MPVIKELWNLLVSFFASLLQENNRLTKEAKSDGSSRWRRKQQNERRGATHDGPASSSAQPTKVSEPGARARMTMQWSDPEGCALQSCCLQSPIVFCVWYWSTSVFFGLFRLSVNSFLHIRTPIFFTYYYFFENLFPSVDNTLTAIIIFKGLAYLNKKYKEKSWSIYRKKSSTQRFVHNHHRFERIDAPPIIVLRKLIEKLRCESFTSLVWGWLFTTVKFFINAVYIRVDWLLCNSEQDIKNSFY